MQESRGGGTGCIDTGGIGETGCAAWALGSCCQLAEEECCGCETGGCSLPETGGCILNVAEDTMRDNNFKSLSQSFSQHFIFAASGAAESAG